MAAFVGENNSIVTMWKRHFQYFLTQYLDDPTLVSMKRKIQTICWCVKVLFSYFVCFWPVKIIVNPGLIHQSPWKRSSRHYLNKLDQHMVSKVTHLSSQ